MNSIVNGYELSNAWLRASVYKSFVFSRHWPDYTTILFLSLMVLLPGFVIRADNEGCLSKRNSMRVQTIIVLHACSLVLIQNLFSVYSRKNGDFLGYCTLKVILGQ
jgi:hypothetical protein